jgi:hypothetical protein
MCHCKVAHTLATSSQDQEQHESDLRGSRGVLLVGVLMLIMASCNFRNTASISTCSCCLLLCTPAGLMASVHLLC